ncbi:non-hemolytic phospholipase C precursor [Penicillium cinerascens]|uniref:Non-hemolytic phospholipase C n=1 Tax=Penicillium cinerascens TaxID=70096 RepID=A0A9W9NFG1_9EURO|nr:non-hemolytic phospholipase C precursor [Penicillium cinerascens]KAJ5218926.1 non-hemolytic phospholipase C precursor [Penicillium cinerascens]
MRTANSCLVVVAAATAVSAASLKDVKHLVFFMQENRAFDHYFGTMAGVRGFADPNVPITENGYTTFQQPVNPPVNGSSILQPWYINYAGGIYPDATMCMDAGSNGWVAMHEAWSNGAYNNWANADSLYSMAYFTRKEIPTHFDIMDSFTILDMSHQSILGPTDPNRCMWLTGSVNSPGSPSNPNSDGGAMLDNTATPGCDITSPVKANCFPFTWKTFPEYLQDAGVSWQLYQDEDNFEDNPLAYFEQYQKAANGSALREKGDSYLGLQAFYKAAAEGTLPSISYIVGPQELSEHPPNRPVDGGWLQQQVVNAVVDSPLYNETVLVISYDEQGGWFDHVPPVVAPKGTPGEWLIDPYSSSDHDNYTALGPGPRVPRVIVSPYTAGGNVFTELTDHTSEIMFAEAWAAAHGYKGVYSQEITPWRRATMSNLVNAFDFENPNFANPSINQATKPPMLPNEPSDYSGDIAELGSLTGPWAQPSLCLSEYPDNQPAVPFGSANANQNMSLLVEEGFKQVRGQLSEGRYLVFEISGFALTNVRGKIVDLSPATAAHEDIRQRWVIHAADDAPIPTSFYIQSALDKTYLGADPLGSLVKNVKDAQAFTFEYQPNGATYTVQLSGQSNRWVSFLEVNSSLAWKDAGAGNFKIFSVAYH